MPSNIEKIRQRPTSPLHELFNLAGEAIKTGIDTYKFSLNTSTLYIKRFDELRERVKHGKKSVRRFDESLHLLQNATAYYDYDLRSTGYFGDEIQPSVRHILYLLTSGFYNSSQFAWDEILKCNKQQMSSLAESLNKPTDKISITDLSKAIMKGDFLPAFLNSATPLNEETIHG